MQTLVVTSLSISELEAIISDCLKNELRRATPPPRHTGNELPPGEAGSAFVSKRQAAALLDCSISTIGNYARAGKLKRHYIGGKSVRFDRAEVLALAERTTSPQTQIHHARKK
jgi:excisionase family DNA binding protein